MRGSSGIGKYFKLVDTRTGKVNVFRQFAHGAKKRYTGRKQSNAKLFIRFKEGKPKHKLF